jgi:TldD protein
MIKIPEELLAKIIRKALSNGGDYADIFVGHERPMTIQLEDDKIEKIVSGVDSGVGVRVIFGDKSAYAYSNDFSEDSLINIASAVSSAVKENWEETSYLI